MSCPHACILILMSYEQGVPWGYPLTFFGKWQNSAKVAQQCIPLLITGKIKLYAILRIHLLSRCLHIGIDDFDKGAPWAYQ